MDRVAGLLLAVAAAAALAGCGAYLNRDMTPLAGAAREGQADRIRLLVKDGADLDQPCGVNHWTPLMHAIHKHRPESVRALIEAGADINARGGRDGSTALMMAAGYGYTDIVNLLLDRGADAHLQISDGTNALSLAILGVPDIDRFTVGECQISTIRTLVERVPDLRLKDSSKIQRALESAKVKGCAGVAMLTRSP